MKFYLASSVSMINKEPEPRKILAKTVLSSIEKFDTIIPTKKEVSEVLYAKIKAEDFKIGLRGIVFNVVYDVEPGHLEIESEEYKSFERMVAIAEKACDRVFEQELLAQCSLEERKILLEEHFITDRLAQAFKDHFYPFDNRHFYSDQVLMNRFETTLQMIIQAKWNKSVVQN